MRLALVCCLLLSLSNLGFTQSEVGAPIIQNFTTSDYEALPQNFAIAQDEREILYFGNTDGLLEYDGISWRKMELPISNTILSLKMIDGKLFLGSIDDFGYVETNSQGQNSFYSIPTNVLDSVLEIGEVRSIHYVKDSSAIFFQAETALIIYRNNDLKIIPFEGQLKNSFLTHGILLLQDEEQGLFQYHEGQIIHAVGHKKLEETEVQKTFSGGENTILVLTRDQGLYKMDLNTYGYPIGLNHIDIPIDPILKKQKVRGASALPYNRVSIATLEGLMIVQDWNRVIQFIDEDYGLQSNWVESQFVDNQSNLWLGLNTGITKIELDYPVSFYNEELGLEGAVESITRHDGKLYAATSAGTYRLALQNATEGSSSKFAFEEILPLQSWDVSSFQSSEESLLLIALNNSVISLDEEERESTLLECYPWMVRPSRIKKDLVFLGLDPGFAVIQRKDGAWNFLGDIPDVELPINSVLELGDVTWLGTRANGVYKIKGLRALGDTIGYDELKYYAEEEGLPGGPVNVSEIDGVPIFGTNGSLFGFNADADTFETKSFGNFPESEYVHRIKWDGSKRLWAIVPTAEKMMYGYIEENAWNSTLFNPIAEEIVHAVHCDEEAVWLGGPNGIYRYDLSIGHEMEKDFPCLIRDVKAQKMHLQKDSLIFGGSFVDSLGGFVIDQPLSEIYDFNYDVNKFIFEFASQAEASPKKQRYQYKLQGFDSDWSDWKKETKAVYTNLPPNEYTMQVRSLNIFGHESEIGTYRFTINKPWWETTWYYLGQTAFFLILISLTFFLNRGKTQSRVAEIIAFITIITIFEFLIMLIEPLFEGYTGGVPVFQLAMNILLALSLAPMEILIRKYLNKG